jgi:hypothetical protein
MTANVDEEVVRRAAAAGGIGCLQKPLPVEPLVDLLIRSKRGCDND